MSTILVVDDSVFCREVVSHALRYEGYEVYVAANGREALELVQRQAVDFMIVDNEMPEMDGLTFLRFANKLPQWCQIPVIMLTAISDEQKVVTALQLGAVDYLLKPAFSVPKLLERLRKWLPLKELRALSPAERAAVEVCTAVHAPPAVMAPPTVVSSPVPAQAAGTSAGVPAWPKLLTRKETLDRADRITAAKTIAGVVSEIMALANSPRAALSDMVRIIESDPILATRILHLANSAAYSGARTRITSLEDAARNIGSRGILDMAMSVGIFNEFPPDESDGFNSIRCWQHSFAVADLMTLLAPKQESQHGAAQRLTGLCHDLGEILLRQHFTPMYDQILEFSAIHRLPLHEVEATALGVRHPELLGRLLAHMGLPATVMQSIREFHEAQFSGQYADLRPQAMALHVANQLAHGLLLAASTHETVSPISRTQWRSLAGDGPPPLLDIVSKRSEIIASTNVLTRLPAIEEKRLLTPILPRTSMRLWYYRPENYVELDPLGCALSFLSDVTISPRLPQEGEWAELDGLVVVGIRAGTAPLVPAALVHACADAQCPELPILALSGQGDPPESTGAITFGGYPISLRDVYEWIKNSIEEI